MTCFEQPLHFNLEVFGGINQISKAGQEICGLGETERVSNWKDPFQDKGYWVRTFVPRYSHCSRYLSNSCTRDLSLRSQCPHRQKNLICFQCVLYQLSQEGFWKMLLIIGEIDILYIPQGRISSCSIGCLYCLDRQRHFQRWGPYVASWMPIVACSWPPRSGLVWFWVVSWESLIVSSVRFLTVKFV